MKQVKIKIPNGLDDIKLSQYQKFLKTTEGSEDVKFISRQMVGIFCNLSDDLVKNMTKVSFDEVAEHLNNLFNFENEAFKLENIIDYNGVTLGFIPNFQDITLGEQVDLEAYIKDWQKMDLAMGVLYRPVSVKSKEKYKIDDYTGNEVSLDVSLATALGAYFFLQNLYIDLLNCIPNFIKEQAKQDKRLQNLELNGVGINQFTDSLKETFLNLKVLLN